MNSLLKIELKVVHIDFVAFSKPGASTDGGASGASMRGTQISGGSIDEAKMLSNHNWHKTGQVRIYDPTFKQCHQDRNPVTNIDLTIISSYFENDLF